MVVMSNVTIDEPYPIMIASISRETHLIFDGVMLCKKIGDDYEGSKDSPEVHTKIVENYFSIFKLGMRGDNDHCVHNHLSSNLVGFD